MKRTRICLDEIAEIQNLVSAFQKAAKGKRHRRNVQLFLENFDENCNTLGRDIRAGLLPYGRFRTFRIFDPKERLIHAACFEDRVFNHAFMNLAGFTLEKAMTPYSYACRPDMGVHRAIQKVQQHLRQYAFYVKVDIAGYFASINHVLLMNVLQRKCKGAECHAQLQRVLDCFEKETGRGLPIGSLTSQYFANYYLDGLDRMLADHSLVRAQVRYMDDIIWWCDTRQQARKMLDIVREWLCTKRDLVLKPDVQIQLSKQGVSYCGFRILRGTIRISRRRKRSYQKRRQYWERLYLDGMLDASGLQRAYASVHAITSGADSREWRKENLLRHPPLFV